MKKTDCIKSSRSFIEKGGKSMKAAEIGIIGLAVMGENLACNLEMHGYTVAVYNIDPEIYVRAFLEKHADEAFLPAYSPRELVDRLQRPRKILMMIRAGSPVDEVIAALLPLLEPGDILIDGGNSHFSDTARRCRTVEAAGCLYVGMGVSGGEEGALHGPALMPGGSVDAWEQLQPILESIAAHGSDGSSCCAWIGSGGAGHFVKMVHNGIEYGEMQLLCEIWHLMSVYLGMTSAEIAEVFDEWDCGALSGYLLEITAQILRFRDTDGSPLLDHILDCAGQKGTGKWASVTALEQDVPLPLVTEAVFSRYLSAMKEERCAAVRIFSKPVPLFQGDRAAFLSMLQKALYAAKLTSYAQGFALLKSAAAEYDWALDYGRISMLWSGGCIIRSRILSDIHLVFQEDPALPHLYFAPQFQQILSDTQDGWRQVCAAALLAGIPIPALASALSYFDAFRTEHLPANLIQAQRDFFGAHRYERTDTPRGVFFHTDWTGHGGETTATAYQG